MLMETASRRRARLGIVFRRRPPAFDLVAIEWRLLPPLDIAPMRDPLLRQIKKREQISARAEQAVERAYGGDKVVASLRFKQRGDHSVGGFTFDARIIQRSVSDPCIASPAEGLLIARRQRRRPEILNHIEIVGLLAPLILRAVDLTDLCLDAQLLQRLGVGEQQPLLAAVDGQNLEGEGFAGRLVDKSAISESVSGLFEQL